MPVRQIVVNKSRQEIRVEHTEFEYTTLTFEYARQLLTEYQ